MFASGLIAGRFMNFFLKLVSRLVLNLAAQHGMAVPVAELCIAVLGQRHPGDSPESPVSLSTARSTPQPLHSSLLGQKPAAIPLGPSHITPFQPSQPASTAAPSHRTQVDAEQPPRAKPPTSSPSARCGEWVRSALCRHTTLKPPKPV